MDRLKRVLTLIFCSTVIGLLFHCCCENELIIVGSGSLELVDDDFNRIDTVESSFALYARFDVSVVSNYNQWSFMNSALATSCSYDYLNSIDESTIEIVCNKEFAYNGEIVTPGTNLFEFEEVFIENMYAEGDLHVLFDKEFVQLADFEPGEYEITLRAKTTDGIEIQNQVSCEIRL